MQLESSDESLACWVGLQSTPSSGMRGDSPRATSATGRRFGWRTETVGFRGAGNR